MIKQLYKQGITTIFSLIALTGCSLKDCNPNNLETYIDKAKNIITNSTKNLEKDFKPRYDDSMLKKWYIIQDKKDYAEKTIGPSNYEEYDIIVPFSGGKWTKTSYIPLIEDIYKNYIGFQESWPELKKENHLKHYNQYLDQFLIRIGSDADLNKDDIVSKQELEELKKLYELQ